MFPGISNARPLALLSALALLPASSGLAADGRHAALDAMLRDLHARGLFHGAIVVSDAGEVVYEAGFELLFWFAPDLELVASRVTGIEEAQRHQ